MPKPLIYIVTGLSGDVSIRCILSVNKNGRDYTGNVRKAFLYPLSRDRRTDTSPCNLLTSDYSRDIVAFYKSAPDGFFRQSNSVRRAGLSKDYPESNFNTDYSWGCGRIGYGSHGCTHTFFAPFWTEGELPERFELVFRAGNLPEKKVVISLVEGNDRHYLPLYLRRYCESLDDRVMRLSSKDRRSYIFGVSLDRGGFSTATSVEAGKIWNEYMTVNRYDDTLVSCYESSRYIAKQVIPLSFDFNLDEILTDVERRQKDIRVSGYYIYNRERLPLYSFDADYVTYSPDIKVWNGSEYTVCRPTAGETPLVYALGNGVEKFHLYEGSAVNYKESPNKTIPRYFRWELCGNSDDMPYIVNGTEEYNFTGYIGRYYHTPMKTSYFGNLDASGVVPPDSDCTQFYKPYQGIWFEERDSVHKNRGTVYNGTCLFNGILYNLEETELKTFTVSLAVKDVGESVTGPVSVVEGKTSEEDSGFLFDKRINSMLFGKSSAAAYTEENLYMITDSDALPDISPEGYVTPVSFPVLVSGCRPAEPPEKRGFDKTTTLKSLLLSFAGILFPDSEQDPDSEPYGPFAFPYSGLDSEDTYGYVRDDFIEASGDTALWDDMVFAAASGSIGNGTGYFRLNKGEYEEILYPTAVDPGITGVYIRKNGFIADYSDLTRKDSDEGAVSVLGSFIPVLPYLHRRGNYVWMADPDCVDEEMIFSALEKLEGRTPEMTALKKNIPVIVWDIRYPGDGPLSSTPADIIAPTAEELVSEICEKWANPKCVFKNREQLYRRFYGPEGIFSSVEDNITDAVLCVNSYGFGVRNHMEAAGIIGKKFDAGIADIEDCYMFDFSKRGFVESAPEARLYLPAENVVPFYRYVLKFMKAENPEALLEELNTILAEHSVKRFAPVRYMHDLSRASGKLYIAEYRFDKPYKIVLPLELVNEKGNWKVKYGDSEFSFDAAILNGSSDLVFDDDDFYKKVIERAFLSTIYNPDCDSPIKGSVCRNIQLNMNEPRNRTESPVSPLYRLWYVDDYVPASCLPVFKEALLKDSATVRFFRRQYRNDDISRVCAPVIEGLGDLGKFDDIPVNDGLEPAEGIFAVSENRFMIPAENIEPDDIPVAGLTGRKPPYVLRSVTAEENDYLKEIGASVYPLCSVPSASSSLVKDSEGAGELKIDLYVCRDRNSFLVRTDESGIIHDSKDGLKRLIETAGTNEILPYINFPILSYLYSLPWAAAPEKTTLSCGLEAVASPDGNIEIFKNDLGNIDIYRYYGWCRPVLNPVGRKHIMYGRYSSEFDFKGEMPDGGVFRYDADIMNCPRYEYSVASSYSDIDSVVVLKRAIPEQKWFNDSRILYLPPVLEYGFGNVAEKEIALLENRAFEIFVKLCINQGLALYNDEEFRLRYLFFNYRTEFHKEHIGAERGEKIYRLRFVFTLK